MSVLFGRSALCLFVLGGCSLCSELSFSSEHTTPQPQRSRSSNNRVVKTRITPHWYAQDTRFWYQNDLPDGKREFIGVDAVKGVRRDAFDHKRLAQALREAGEANAPADRLPIDDLKFDATGNTLTFRSNGTTWECDLKTYALKKVKGQASTGAPEGLPAYSPESAPRRSLGQGPDSAVTFVNQTEGEVELFWLDTGGQRRSYGKLAAGKERQQHTFARHVWAAVSSEGTTLAVFIAQEPPSRAVITGKTVPYQRRGDGPRRNTRRGGPPAPGSGKSPDGKWSAEVKDNNIFIRSDDGTDIQLSHDGTSELSYGMLQWAPDSKTLVAQRIEKGESKEVHLVESSPRGGGRAKLRSRPYALPGDKFTSYELNLFEIATKKQTKPKVDRIDFGRPRLRWNRDGHRFTYEKTDRGHQRFRLIEVDSHTGESRTIFDEQTETFIWTAHGPNLRTVTYLDESDELLVASERDGWRHLYLVDAEKGRIVNQITKGPWVVRGIDRVDEENRRVWFRASGVNPDQDPYLIHYYRINFDGSGFVALTEGNGTHSISPSPGRKYLLDTFTRIDMAAVHQLRRASDGKLMCELEQADITQLTASGWEPPEVFSAKGRDGKTDIWGIICRPREFDPSKKYPIIEDIYAGPHGSHVPKSFSAGQRYSSLTELGFIVVKIDGMGTANRSKAFHDVCWHNLKDAGFPDRILWMQAAAKKYPYMDVSRVGIYGVSAGGQNAAGAVLFHPEFYKAAVASCGCHDNRMDKASWNEQWMGYPVGPHYGECSNIDNADRLQGQLLLIVGELDTNVPPESTMRLVDALIKADKDFDLIVVPGAGHSNGGSYGQRRLRDFFVEHLQGATTTQ